MKEIAYKSPTSLADAVALLSDANGRAKILAGGTDILVQLRELPRDEDILVDVKRIPELTAIDRNPSGGWRIGAAVPCTKIQRNAELMAAYPALADSVRIIGGWQIQSRATLGGNLSTSSPAADSVPALIAHGASLHVIGPEGSRTVPVEAFATGPGRNSLSRGELIVDIELPAPEPHSSGCYIRFIPRYEMDIAVVGAGVWLRLDGAKVADARISLGAVAPTPILAIEAAKGLVGQEATEESFAAAGEAARAAASPISDMRGPADYRKHLVGVLVKRALLIAQRRIAGETVNPLKDGHC